MNTAELILVSFWFLTLGVPFIIGVTLLLIGSRKK
jgi:hypothetical protein